MSVITDFDGWFNGLSQKEKQELLDHLFNKRFVQVNEGFFAGPTGDLVKGMFAGPSASSQGRCPTCGR